MNWILTATVAAAVLSCASALSSSLPVPPLDKGPDLDRKGWNIGGIGLSSVLNDVITELNSTFQTQAKGRSAKSNFDPNVYNGMLTPVQPSSKIDVLSLIPTLLIVGLGIMLLPVIITCFTQIVAPLTYPSGRRKREAPDTGFPFEKNLIIGLMNTLEDALSKFSK